MHFTGKGTFNLLFLDNISLLIMFFSAEGDYHRHHLLGKESEAEPHK
jgi:hypothetical protein